MARVIGLDEAIADFLRVDRDAGYGNCNAYAIDRCGSYGYGFGADSGDIKNIYGAQVHIIDGMLTIIRSIHGNVAAGGVLSEDLNLRRCYVVKGVGFFAHGETLREAQKALELKILNNMPTAERIAEFISRFKPGKKYAARLYYDWHHILTGSCKMGREAFARDHGYDLDKDELTPEEFMELTKDAYGGSVIRELIAAWTKAAMGPAGPGKGD